jgi:hypothetical protein
MVQCRTSLYFTADKYTPSLVLLFYSFGIVDAGIGNLMACVSSLWLSSGGSERPHECSEWLSDDHVQGFHRRYHCDNAGLLRRVPLLCTQCCSHGHCLDLHIQLRQLQRYLVIKSSLSVNFS